MFRYKVDPIRQVLFAVSGCNTADATASRPAVSDAIGPLVKDCPPCVRDFPVGDTAPARTKVTRAHPFASRRRPFAVQMWLRYFRPVCTSAASFLVRRKHLLKQWQNPVSREPTNSSTRQCNATQICFSFLLNRTPVAIVGKRDMTRRQLSTIVTIAGRGRVCCLPDGVSSESAPRRR